MFLRVCWIAPYFIIMTTQVVSDWRYVASTGSSYHKSDTQMKYSDAVCYCHSLGSSLIIIETKTEMEYIENWLQNVDWGLWTGATDLKQEGDFVWWDGTPVLPQLWHEGEPNNMDELEHCAQLTVALWDGDVNMTLSDLPETSKRFALCERNPSVKTSITLWQVTSQEVIYNDHVIGVTSNISSTFECFMNCQKFCRCNSAAYQSHTAKCYMYDTFFSRFSGVHAECPGCIGYE